MKRLVPEIWDRLSVYLPIVMMGLAALATWWLVRGAPPPRLAEIASAVRHEPDYTVRNVVLRTFDPSGNLKSELTGQTAVHFPDTDSLELTQVRMHAYGQDGSLMIGQANQAVSNRDGSSVLLSGSVRVERRVATVASGKKTTFSGEQLGYTREPPQLRANVPVRVNRGTDWFTADRMVVDDKSASLVLDGRVKAQFAARTSP